MINQMDQVLGDFTVGDKVMVSDPCYEDGDQIINTLPGIWSGSVAYRHTSIGGERVATLLAYNKDHFSTGHIDESRFCFITDELGVDSGQMAICDLAHYSYSDEEYDKYCAATDHELGGNIVGNYAVVSRTGWGDGEYTLYGIFINDNKSSTNNEDKSKNEVCCALMVEFMTDTDDE